MFVFIPLTLKTIAWLAGASALVGAAAGAAAVAAGNAAEKATDKAIADAHKKTPGCN